MSYRVRYADIPLTPPALPAAPDVSQFAMWFDRGTGVLHFRVLFAGEGEVRGAHNVSLLPADEYHLTIPVIGWHGEDGNEITDTGP